MEIDESRPIWPQLVEEFRRRVSVGEWAPGARIPSVRELALDIGVNPNTVQRALSDTDREGLTVPLRTSGRYITKDLEAIQRTRSQLAEATVARFVAVVAGIGMDMDETIMLVKRCWPETRSAITDQPKDKQ